MKRLFCTAILMMSCVSLQSCAELAAGLSSFNQANGSQCAEVSCDFALYKDGSYQDSYIRTKNSDGDDVKNAEKRWLTNKRRSYLNYSFGLYYATSPYTDANYRFSVICTAYY